MGCDIHLFVERRNPNRDQWELVLPPIEEREYRNNNKRDDIEDLDYRASWFDARNYTLFGYLNDVRGAPIIEPFTSVLGDRGYPKNMSAALSDVVRQWGQDAHSPFHGNLPELLSYFNNLRLHLADGIRAHVEDLLRMSSWYLFLEELRTLPSDGDPSRIRVIAFFDN